MPKEMIETLESLGYCGMIGLMRAKMHKLISATEYTLCKEYAHNVLGVPRDWWSGNNWIITVCTDSNDYVELFVKLPRDRAAA